MYASRWGKPHSSASQDWPPLDVRYTRQRASGVQRLNASPFGMQYAVPDLWGWATIGKPKSDGTPSPMSFHVAA